jgi:hypothetical protein
MPIDEDLGLSEREKELKKWNAPYVYREFPKMLYRGVTTTAGRFTLEDRTVASAGEEAVATEAGWLANPERARIAEETRQEAVGLAAAERAYTDRSLSAAARAEAGAADAASARHLGEIPVRPTRPRPHRTKPTSKLKPTPTPVVE